MEKFKKPEKFGVEVFLKDDNYLFNFEISEISNSLNDKLVMNEKEQFE